MSHLEGVDNQLFLCPEILSRGLNTAPIDIIETKAKQKSKKILTPSPRTGGPRFQKLHYRSNLKRASNDLQFDVHLVHRVLRPMVKNQRNRTNHSVVMALFWYFLVHFPKNDQK